MKISDLKKIKMSHLSIIKAFNYLETRDDNISIIRDIYSNFLEKQCPKIDWISAAMGDDDDGSGRENLYNVYDEFDGVKITMAIPFIKTHYKPEIYNTYEDMINDNKYIENDEIKSLKPRSYSIDNGDDEVWRDEYGRWIYQTIDTSTDYKYYYAKIIMEYENQYFFLDDKAYKTLYDAHKMAMDNLNKIKNDAIKNELVYYDFNWNDFEDESIKTAEESGLKELYDPKYDNQKEFNFDESIQKLKGIL